MANLLRMPEVAANASHATLQAWTKQEGDAVAIGDCLAEIETDKAVIEFNADFAGVMGKILIQAGQEVEVGTPIGVLLRSGETNVDVQALVSTAGGASAPAEAPSSATLIADQPAAILPARTTASIPMTSRIFASPSARRLAREREVSLDGLRGSGPNGRIVKRDVESAVVVPVANAAAVASAVSGASAYTEVPHSNMRRTIARRLSESKASIPHFYLSADCRMDRLLALRSEINAAAPRKISVNDFVVRAVALALQEVPAANVGWTENAMRQYAQADIAVAVSTDSGLITPIVRAASQKSLSAISEEISDLAARARASQLRPDEYQGGSFSVSNLGMYGVSEFSAIINPPQAAILAVGATRQIPVVEEGLVKVASVMRCALSVDHRAIDGVIAAQWIAAYQRLIENPLLMLI